MGEKEKLYGKLAIQKKILKLYLLFSVPLLYFAISESLNLINFICLALILTVCFAKNLITQNKIKKQLYCKKHVSSCFISIQIFFSNN